MRIKGENHRRRDVDFAKSVSYMTRDESAKWLLRADANQWMETIPEICRTVEFHNAYIPHKNGGVPKWLKGMVC